MPQRSWRLGAFAAIVATATLLWSVASRAQLLPPDGAVRITQQDFKKLIAVDNVLAVDTRHGDVYRIGHIPGAVLLPVEGLSIWPPQYEKVVDMLKASNKPIVTYCA